MGDIILTSPIFRLLAHKGFSDTTFLTKKKYVGLLKYNPYLRSILTLADDLRDTINILKSKNFDLIIDLQRSVRSKRVSTKLGIRTLICNKNTLEKIQVLAFRKRNIMISAVPSRYIETLSSLGIRNDGLGLDFFIPDGVETHGAISALKKNIVIVTGGNYPTKRLPPHLVKDIIRNDDIQFQLLGGSDVATELRSLEKKNCYNGIGKLSLYESSRIIQKADVVVTGDTGLMHIAAAFQKPIVAVWGSTSPNFGFSPYYGKKSKQRFISVMLDMYCRPCSKYGRNTCPLRHMNCLNKISADSIHEAIKELQG